MTAVLPAALSWELAGLRTGEARRINVAESTLIGNTALPGVTHRAMVFSRLRAYPGVLNTVRAPRARLADGMDGSEPYLLHPIGVVRSTLRAVARAPNQAFEGAPEALLEIDPALANALHRIEPGDELIVLTWLHLADRRVLQTHPMGDERIPLTGVFRTRSPDRPNPIGVHRVTVTGFEGPTTFRVGALEAIDGTPIVDLKIVMDESRDE